MRWEAAGCRARERLGEVDHWHYERIRVHEHDPKMYGPYSGSLRNFAFLRPSSCSETDAMSTTVASSAKASPDTAAVAGAGGAAVQQHRGLREGMHDDLDAGHLDRPTVVAGVLVAAEDVA